MSTARAHKKMNNNETIINNNHLVHDIKRRLHGERKYFCHKNRKKKVPKNWDRLEELLGSDVGIYGAIENMKVSRNALAHPDLPLKELSKCLEADKLSLIDEGMCDRFIEALNKLSVKTHAN